MGATAIELRDIQVSLDRKPILQDINLTIERGDFMTFLGPSGCGKTTLLRTIAGLQKVEKGTIAISGREVANGATDFHMEPSKRRLSLVFQSYALWPHMTVYDNVAFGLQVRKMPKPDIQKSVHAALDKMRIPELADRYPSELSGGQQQRVAIARAIVTEPDILLLDEPLSNLDAKLRVEMRAELKRIHQELNTTIIYVTHDQHEAMTLSTKVAVFFGGRIVQLDKPSELYKHPRTLQVAQFIGNTGLHMNAVEGRITGDSSSGYQLHTPLAVVPLEHSSSVHVGREVVMTVRPEDIKLIVNRIPGSTAATVEAIFPSGADTHIQLQAGGASMMARVMGEPDCEPGDLLFIHVDTEQINLYDKQTGVRIEHRQTARQQDERTKETDHNENRLSYSR